MLKNKNKNKKNSTIVLFIILVRIVVAMLVLYFTTCNIKNCKEHSNMAEQEQVHLG